MLHQLPHRTIAHDPNYPVHPVHPVQFAPLPASLHPRPSASSADRLILPSPFVHAPPTPSPDHRPRPELSCPSCSSCPIRPPPRLSSSASIRVICGQTDSSIPIRSCSTNSLTGPSPTTRIILSILFILSNSPPSPPLFIRVHPRHLRTD